MLYIQLSTTDDAQLNINYHVHTWAYSQPRAVISLHRAPHADDSKVRSLTTRRIAPLTGFLVNALPSTTLGIGES